MLDVFSVYNFLTVAIKYSVLKTFTHISKQSSSVLHMVPSQLKGKVNISSQGAQ